MNIITEKIQIEQSENYYVSNLINSDNTKRVYEVFKRVISCVDTLSHLEFYRCNVNEHFEFKIEYISQSGLKVEIIGLTFDQALTRLISQTLLKF